MFKIFKKRNPIDTLLKIGHNDVYISNGISLFNRTIFNKDVYVNQYLIIGIGRYYAGYGDWGYGFDSASTSQIIFYIDKELKIKKIEICEPFFDTNHYDEDKKIFKKISKFEDKIKLDTKFICNNPIIMNWITTLLSILPTNFPINQENILKYNHMLNYYISESEKLNKF